MGKFVLHTEELHYFSSTMIMDETKVGSYSSFGNRHEKHIFKHLGYGSENSFSHAFSNVGLNHHLVKEHVIELRASQYNF